MSNEVAPEGKVWVCCACGKRSQDRYGYRAYNRGWDVSCMLNANLFDENRLMLDVNGLVTKITDEETETAS